MPTLQDVMTRDLKTPDTDSSLTCPRDAGGLKHHHAKGYDVLQCEECQGLLLPPRTVEAALGKGRHGIPQGTTLTAVRCPWDGVRMELIRRGQVEIDVCPSCSGVWLDRGELERILRKRRGSTVAQGGLEVASTAGDVAVAGAGELGGAAIELVVEVVAGIFSGL